MPDREIIGWFTVNGAHVPIFSGQSKKEAAKKYLEGKQGKASSSTKASTKAAIDKDEKNKQEQIRKNAEQVSKGNGKEYTSELLKVSRELKEGKEVTTHNKDVVNAYKSGENKGRYEVKLNNDGTATIKDLSKMSETAEKTKQEQIKKNEEQKQSLTKATLTKAQNDRFNTDLEKARNGDLSSRNDYVSKVNNITAKLQRGNISADRAQQLLNEAKELKEKISKIEGAYKESDTFKKAQEDRKQFEAEQAAKRAERVIADVETLKDKEGLYNPKNIQDIVKKMDDYRDAHEKQSPHIKIGGNEYDTIPLMGDNGKPEGYSLIPQSGKGYSNPFLASNGKVYDSSNSYTREKLGLDAENEKVKAQLRLEKKAEAIREAYEKQQSFKGTTYEVMEKDGKYVVVGGNNNGHLDPGSWHAKRQDYLDRGYKPLPDEDYKKFSPGRQVSDAASGKAVDAERKSDTQKGYTVKESTDNDGKTYRYISGNTWSAHLMGDKSFNVRTIHPYDDAERHWAKGVAVKFRSGTMLAKIIYKGRVVEEKEFKYTGGDHGNTFRDIADYLDKMDKKAGVKSRISHW